MRNDTKQHLEFIYGKEQAENLSPELQALLDKWRARIPQRPELNPEELPLDQSHVVMITYGDSIRRPKPQADGSIAFEGSTEEAPLQTLKSFAEEWLSGMISTIHLLPCFPYTSDDGFSVADYRSIDPMLGNWDDVAQLRKSFHIMYDLVLNHCSKKISWFQGFLDGDPQYEDFFVCADPAEPRLKEVFRPRALPLLHEYQGKAGKKTVWTTFSEDQVDVNFANPKVLLEYLDIFLSYVEQGAQIVRLDAIGFLWKELGTACMHHPKTHAVVKLMRSIVKELAPQAVILTETNVPHKENISYFGDGHDEAQMVYQFSLPPLTLNTFMQGDASHLREWAKTLPQPNPHFSFFNFLASHDGIGMLPARGYLSQEEQDYLVAEILRRGGKVNYKSTPEGDIPYELNMNYLDAIAEKELPVELRAKKFLAAQSILLSMAGVPGIYVHSLLGSGNWIKGMEESGINRRINREKLDVQQLRSELQDPSNIRYHIYQGMKQMLKVRRAEPAFAPQAEQQILETPKQVFALSRGSAGRKIHCYVNTANSAVSINCAGGTELISGKSVAEGNLELKPFQVLWLK